MNNKKNKEIKVYLEKIKPRLEEISEIILSKEEISFLHSGHLGDVINSLPLIKELSKKKKCKLNIQLNKILPNNENGMYGKYFLRSSRTPFRTSNIAFQSKFESSRAFFL